jgi:hypothetical protein
MGAGARLANDFAVFSAQPEGNLGDTNPLQSRDPTAVMCVSIWFSTLASAAAKQGRAS